jgi:hypothetical protein
MYMQDQLTAGGAAMIAGAVEASILVSTVLIQRLVPFNSSSLFQNTVLIPYAARPASTAKLLHPHPRLKTQRSGQ